ncbi:MAG: quinate 5-dehydrogenase [Candidatus Xenobia bacterium]
MKHIVSVSLGSSARDHAAEVELLGEKLSIRRMGTDGDFKKALAVLADLDGNVNAIGLGGVDVYLYSRSQRYALRDGLRLMHAVKTTPVVDGSGLKNTLERRVVAQIQDLVAGRRVLMVCAMDRFGMAEALEQSGARCVYGDLIFALGKDQAINSLAELEERADKLLPEVSKLPIGFLYPIGKNQEASCADGEAEKYHRYYLEAEVIAGDFHFIRKYLPPQLPGRTIITNTITHRDVEDLRNRGVATLVTTTPEFGGRSFGTNVLEAALLALLGKRWEDVTAADYTDLIERLDLKPRIENLQVREAV